MPNGLAYLMLLIWPVLMIMMFRRMPAHKALVWSLLGAYLFLPPAPAAFDFPLLPPFNKDTIPNLMLLVICLAMYGRGIFKLPSGWVGKLLIALFILGPIFTVFANPEFINFLDGSYLPGLRVTDAIALTINQATLLVPVLLARQLLSTTDEHRDLLMILLICGLVYSIPMLLEVRLSPILNLKVFGYFQHSFAQALRGGGYRPVVFMNHGLWVAFFAMTTAMAGIALWKADKSGHRSLYLLAGGYLIAVLVLCKSLGALVFAIFLTPLIFFVGQRIQLAIALVLVMLSLSYPVLKNTSFMPTEFLLEQAGKVSEDRRGSLYFRLYNEDLLLKRANEKPLFGWGSWGRNHLHNPENGEILTVTDGRWIITFGVFGWIGFIAEFGLLALPLILLWRGSRNIPPERMSPYVGPLALLLAVNVLDLLPNATLTPLTWLLAGALLGYVENMKKAGRETVVNRQSWQPLM